MSFVVLKQFLFLILIHVKICHGANEFNFNLFLCECSSICLWNCQATLNLKLPFNFEHFDFVATLIWMLKDVSVNKMKFKYHVNVLISIKLFTVNLLWNKLESRHHIIKCFSFWCSLKLHQINYSLNRVEECTQSNRILSGKLICSNEQKIMLDNISFDWIIFHMIAVSMLPHHSGSTFYVSLQRIGINT